MQPLRAFLASFAAGLALLFGGYGLADSLFVEPPAEKPVA